MTTACPAAKAALASAATIGTCSWDQILSACTALYHPAAGRAHTVQMEPGMTLMKKLVNLWHVGMAAFFFWRVAADSAA